MSRKSIVWWAVAAILLVLAIAIPVNAADILGKDCAEAYLFEPGSQVKCEKETEFNMWSQLLIDSNQNVMDGVKKSTVGYKTINTDPGTNQVTHTGVVDLKNKILLVAELLGVLAITYSGYVWIVSPSNPKARAKAKRQLTNAIYMLIFLNAGFFIANLGYDLGIKTASYLEADTQEFFTKTPWEELKNENTGNDLEGTYAKFSSLAASSPLLILSGWAYITLMFLRNILVVLLLVLAPLLVVLFFFEQTKPFGSMLALIFVVELFLPVLFFPLFKVSTFLFTGDANINIMIMASTLVVAFLLHIAVIGLIVVKSAGSLRPQEDDD